MLAALFLLLLGSPAVDISKGVDPLSVSEEMQTYFDARVGRAAGEHRRLELLLDSIFDKGGIGFTYSTVTRSARGTFEKGDGDCLSFTNLFIAAGRYLGMDVRYHEVELAPNWSKRGNVVVFNRHVNVVAFIKGKPYLIDLFPRVNRVEVGGRVITDERGRAHFFNNLGAEWFAKESPATAIEYFEAAIRSDQTATFAWSNLGVAQTCLGLSEEAESSYKKAIKHDRDNMVALVNLAELLEREGREKDSQQLSKKVEQFKQKNPYYHFSLGEDAYAAGEFRAAAMHYRTAIKRKSREHRFHHALAKALVELGDTEEAEKELRKAQKYAPDESRRLRYSQKLTMLSSVQE